MKKKEPKAVSELMKDPVARRLICEDWSEYTVAEIAREMDLEYPRVRWQIDQLEKVHGIRVERVKRRRHNHWSIPGQLMERDWSNCNTTQIAEALCCERRAVLMAINLLKKEGFEVVYRRRPRGRPKGTTGGKQGAT